LTALQQFNGKKSNKELDVKKQAPYKYSRSGLTVTRRQGNSRLTPNSNAFLQNSFAHSLWYEVLQNHRILSRGAAE
jgi:hypothetical protein